MLNLYKINKNTLLTNDEYGGVDDGRDLEIDWI
nr:MAG TPA: hypothetical protein [Caudoviricetes sp.]